MMTRDRLAEPAPSVLPVIVSHDPLEVAFQTQPGVEVTATLNVPPIAGTLWVPRIQVVLQPPFKDTRKMA